MLDSIYQPPPTRRKWREWEEWAATQSGKRHNPVNVARPATVRLRFRVAYWEPHVSFAAGGTSNQTLMIKEYVQTETPEGTLQAIPVKRRRYEIY